MKEQLVIFLTAKLAKEKGFDFRVFNSYNEDGIIEQNNQELMYELFANRHLPKGSISAPTQSLLQKWLREKHKLFIQIIEYNKDGSLIIQITHNRVIVFDKMTNYDINEYELTLEEGLQEALKLI